MKRDILVGYSAHNGQVRVIIDTRDTEKGKTLSIMGELWLPSKRDVECAGQMQDHLVSEIARFIVPREKIERLVELWNRWHNNDMHAGCAHQRAEGWDKRPIDPNKPLNDYGKHFEGQRSSSWNMLSWIPREEHPEGLLGFPCSTCGYKFGSSWLFEAIPAEVLTELENWPN